MAKILKGLELQYPTIGGDIFLILNLKISHQENTKFQIPKNCLFILEMAGRYLDQ